MPLLLFYILAFLTVTQKIILSVLEYSDLNWSDSDLDGHWARLEDQSWHPARQRLQAQVTFSNGVLKKVQTITTSDLQLSRSTYAQARIIFVVGQFFTGLDYCFLVTFVLLEVVNLYLAVQLRTMSKLLDNNSTFLNKGKRNLLLPSTSATLFAISRMNGIFDQIVLLC